MLEIEFRLSTVDHSSWTPEIPFLLQELSRHIAELKVFAYRTEAMSTMVTNLDQTPEEGLIFSQCHLSTKQTKPISLHDLLVV